ncbi:MAG: helix-turn-helix domain-containing protein [Candidatus Pedobacter colombiensis]|uniref:Helix-turn-helix domain-containing protein n=1 Tax=Candidatus Pedobacter colombiensis TaxID=3121371 RepID=A0AAJ5WBH9_9SPHI|nr:helix-turn-helix domain-containing protein [Pedobacter sp.]WEK21414.1 MAG: helix-turn-helix domain-containing protein [Pedobacter sp.]
MATIEQRPGRALLPYISSYWEIGYQLAKGDTVPVPFGCTGRILMVLSLNGDISCIKDNGQSIERTKSTLIGQVTQPYTQIFSGPTLGMVIAFTPAGCAALWGLPMHELTDDSLHLPEIILGFDTITDQLRMASDTAQRFTILDVFLMKLLKKSKSIDKRIEAATQVLINQPGKLNIKQLAGYVNSSERTLNRRFTEQVGLSPKEYARVIRFLQAKRWLLQRANPDWRTLLHTLGYYDQSHLINEFRHFTGKAPTAYLPTFSHDYDILW